ncbi:MAG: Transglutaminase-like superfamily protein [Pelotomaculum sp. PtaB.Bin104]|nr:MAG: Transglutaminase-like superfamily protein [Pelotomaculum sp. PtaB.Bin104]
MVRVLSYIAALAIVFIIFVPEIASAATYQPAQTTNLSETLTAQTYTAMQAHQTSITIEYTGDVDSLKNDISNAINKAYNTDDYLHLLIKGWELKAYGIPGDITVAIHITYRETQEQLLLVEQKTSEILSQIINDDMNDYQKEKAIHDYIVSNVSYDQTLQHFTDYDALTSGTAVCQGYTMLAYKMLTKAGIQARIVSGLGKSEEHTWNMVNLEGSWYHLDCTWDDPVPDAQGRITYSYYNLSDSQIKADHSWQGLYPEANTDFGQFIKLILSGL